MKGCDSFSSWDETYVHFKHNTKDRTVLEVRTDGDLKEPWTWVRTQGKGRVFYTAWGHDQRTWSHSGFQTLLERGTRWACGQDLEGATTYIDRPTMTPFAADAKPFEYVPATIPFYPPGERWGTIREPVKQMQKPLPAAESLKHYTTPKDFEMRTFVTEEQLGGGKPIAMTWDERGRLWLALTWDYPNEMKREGEGRDKIVTCEDTKGNGVCDKVTVFAEKLSIPTSILRVHGGLLVHQAPHTLFLRDSKGDGHADVRQVLFSGWGIQDTHAGPSNLRYGFDNWIYGIVGYSGFNGTVAGERLRFGQGLYRFKLEMQDGKLSVTKLEFLRSTSNNSWGVGFNEDGELFGSTANGCPLVHLTIPNRYYEKVRGLSPGALQSITLDNHFEPVTDKIRQVDFHGGFTAAAGCTIYTARTYPPKYWNRTAFVSDPTGHLCATFVLEPHGTSYIARYGWNLCASRDEWAAPIDAQVGPDGNVWVLDWYNIIVQHNPTPPGYREGKGKAYEIDLRDKKYARVYRVVYTKAKHEPRMDLKDASAEVLNQTLHHDNLFWRLQAQRLLVESNPRIISGVILKQIMAGLQSDNPRIRLQALLNIANNRNDERNGPLIVSALKNPANLSDPALKDALTIAASVNDIQFLLAAVKEEDLPASAQPILNRAARQYASDMDRTKIGALLAALNESKSNTVFDAILSGLAAEIPGSAKSVEFSANEQQAVASLLTRVQGSTRARLLKIARSCGMAGLDAALAGIAKEMSLTMADAAKSDELRLEAAAQMLEFQPENDDVANQLLTVAAKASPKLAVGIFEALSNSKAKNLGPAIALKLKDLPPSVRPAALRILLARPESTKAFLDSVEKGELRFDLLALDQKTALASHPDKAISERAKKLLALGGGLPDPDRQKVIDQFSYVTKKTGDAGIGKKVFTQHCAKCHKHSGEGNTIGPELTGFAVHPKEHILIDVLDPSRSVEGNFKQYTAKLEDGRVISGLLASETKTTVELLDAENKRHALARSDIEQLKESPKSLMPEGFEKQMSAEDLTNLLEFLTQKGKYVPIPLDKVATIVSTKGMFFDGASTAERLVLADWKPREVKGVPFLFVDPQGEKQKNVILLYGPQGTQAPSMPKSATLPCNTAAKAIHFLSGVSGWGSPGGERGSVSMTVRFIYEDGKTEDHDLKNGIHFADYIRRVDVAESAFAFELRGRQQMRYLSVAPKRNAVIKSIELVKGPDRTAPIVMAVTIETP
jgi:hypothetical protein